MGRRTQSANTKVRDWQANATVAATKKQKTASKRS